ncbi:NAD(P)/FAD-dependent oxidoreductase [Candidatus Micrarchaeota archaeon]|nr:NAD(P)/FAD-dependent oxidoreductase [Candidatus Micrarchaeota archaeon]MBU1166492.1 NAD(P)/FAD-dependent oxidoreductase [Candidatus Micrarchaeota archaeon]MBU1887207.1 NAD(P)/FAD-dependent oxidoreductase [Candidatus Micrarchaeota archaeon]
MKYDHDVIIIGGGPSGSTFARAVAAEGMDVLVIDKRKEIGVPVRCGEGLGQREVISQGLEIPRQCYSTEITGAKVIAPNGKSIVWKDDNTKGWVLERKIFDKWLCELAIEKGAKVKTYTRALEVLKDTHGKINGVKLSHGGREPYDIHAPLIISAEGMESMMARQMGFKTVHSLYDVDTCYQYEMKPYNHENLIELYFGNKIAPRGYVWIFPKCDKKANVGIGIGGNLINGKKGGSAYGATEGTIDGAAPKHLLDEFIKNNEQLKDASTLVDFGGIISVGAPIDEFVKDNCMVIGTAAKQVDPIHGGGIALAMESAMLAASIVLDAYKEKNYSKEKLFEYDKQWRATAGKKVAKRLMLRKVMEKVSDDDLNHIFNSITDHDLEQTMEGKFAGPVAKIIAGRPQLLGVLSALLPGKK